MRTPHSPIPSNPPHARDLWLITLRHPLVSGNTSERYIRPGEQSRSLGRLNRPGPPLGLYEESFGVSAVKEETMLEITTVESEFLTASTLYTDGIQITHEKRISPENCVASENSSVESSSQSEVYSHLNTRKNNMLSQYRSHTLECDGCGKQSSELGSLTTHARTHTSEEPFKSDSCGKCCLNGKCRKDHDNADNNEDGKAKINDLRRGILAQQDEIRTCFKEIINIPTDTPDAMLYAPRRLRGLGVFIAQWEAYLQHLNICQRLLHVDNPHVAATRNLPNEIEHCIKQLPIILDSSERISSQKLRKALREDSFHQWSKLKSKVLGFVFYSQWKKGNSWISTKKGLSSSQWTQAIKMKCNRIPVCTLPGRTLDSTHCRRCDEQETLPHVLGFCHHGELLRINRHNTVRSIITASIRQNAFYEVYEEVACVSSDGSTRRADIIIIDRQKDKGVILDPTIHFEMHEQQPQKVCREKQVICEPCCQYLGAKYHITHWTVFGLMSSARDTISRKTLNQLKQFKISDATIDAIGSHVLKSALAVISNHLYPRNFYCK
ncbi:hypothetical protein ANN_10852 [Periplaneta americana]|uniref:C2H2-type domain-containing protein n=1 Tax=Periplaneta americana TaxID=6978 RepID=A0ABQ8T4Y3_PERAM|nr:hypothetical protein ANN_10852 [Periplaneta americana]